MKPSAPSGAGLPEFPAATAFAQGACGQSTEIYLQPGEYGVADHRHRFRTLLGSCVSITLWHPRLRVGAMSHFLLASRMPGEHAVAGPTLGRVLDGRYGEEALELMLQKLGAYGIDGRQCEAKIFGGGDMFPTRAPQGLEGVGRRNGEAARRLLEARGIALHSESLFGIGHRRIIFDIASGDVWCHQIKPASPAPGKNLP